MEGIHPTVAGTKLLLQEIDKRTAIVSDERFITDTKMYRGVNSVFKYGCLFCHQYLDLNGAFICPGCRPTPFPLGEEQPSHNGNSGPGGNEYSEAELSPITQHDVESPPTSPASLIIDERDYDMDGHGRKREGGDCDSYSTPKKCNTTHTTVNSPDGSLYDDDGILIATH